MVVMKAGFGSVFTDLITLSHEYQHNYKGKCNVSVNKPIPGLFCTKAYQLELNQELKPRH